MSADRVAELMKNNRQQYLEDIRSDVRAAQQAGISATPGFLIYSTGSSSGEKIMGAQPYQNFVNAVQRQLQGGSGNVSVSNISIEGEPYIG
ncbi:MAG: hypothetical protein ABEJ66_02020, partial [Candidatus Nanohaloarchaea archaeon]